MKSQEKYLLLVYTNELVKYDSIIRCTQLFARNAIRIERFY